MFKIEERIEVYQPCIISPEDETKLYNEIKLRNQNSDFQKLSDENKILTVVNELVKSGDITLYPNFYDCIGQSYHFQWHPHNTKSIEEILK